MASKQVQELKIVLGVSGADKLAGLKSAFKGLTQTIGVTDDVVSSAVASIKNYVSTASKSEAAIKGQITAFEALKSQADVTGTAYQELDADIKKLKEELRGASDGVMKQRDSLIKNAASTKASSGEVARYVEQLKKLQVQTRANSEAFKGIEDDIESLTQKMVKLRQQELADFGKKAFEGTKGAVGGLKTGIEQSIALFKRLGEQSKTALGVVGRSVEGIAAIGAGGAIAGVSAGGLGNIASLLTGGGSALAGLRQTLGGTPLIGGQLEKLVTPEAIARLNEAGANLSALQSKVAGLDQAMDAITTAFTAFGPTASAGAIAASAGIAIIYDRLKKSADETRIELEKSFKGIDDEVQALMKDLVKLNDQLRQLSLSKINELLAAARGRFAGAPAGSPLSRSMASQIAGLEAMARQESAAQAQVLEEYRQRVRGTSQAATDLSDRLSYLRARLQEVDTSTSEGKAEFASLSRESLQLSETLKKLGDSYRHVSTMATQAATAQENAANAAVRANYFNRGAVAAQERAMAELGARVRAGVAGTPLALPAAGGTTAPGTGQAISGGARRLAGQVETTFGPAQFRNPRAIEFMGRGNLPTAATGVAPAVGYSGADPSIQRTVTAYGEALEQLRRVRREFDGTINALESQRNAWNNLRNAVDPTSTTFANATKQVNQLDERLKKLQTTQQQTRRRMSGMQMAQAAGAAISGGIFGGPEGFFGGALGGIFGGVGGAFAGAAAGAQVGMLRQQLGEFADYAAQIQKMEIALRNAAGSQDQFNQAMAAASAATKNLNVPQDVAIQGMTKLTAAVKGAGGQVSDAELVFNNVTAAIKATGGSAQDVDGAITAMVQVFSKGKVSAEELSGQLGERLPGAVTKFAEANQMTLPELQKALEQGQVGLNELMNFIVQLGDEYAGVAGQIAGSSQDAGARLTVAYNNMRIAVGEALQPIGAAFQEAFIPFIEQITPVLVDVLPKIGELALALAKNFDTAAIALGAFVATLAVAKITSFTFSLGALITGLSNVAKAAGGAATAMTGLAAASAAVPWVALAAGAAAAGAAIYNAATAQQEFNKKIYEAPLVDVQAEIQQLSKDLFDAEEKLLNTAMQFGTLSREAAFAQAKVDGLRAALDQAKGDYKVRLLYEQVGVTPSDKYFGPGFAPGPAQIKPNELPKLDSGSGKGAGKTKKERESQLPQLLAELAVQQQIAQINAYIRQAQLDGNEFLKIRLEGEKQIAEIAGQIRAIQFEKIPADEAEVKRKQLMLKAEEARLDTLQRLRELDKKSREEITRDLNEIGARYTDQIEKAKAIAEMVKSGITPALAEQYYEIDQTVEKERELLEQKIAQLELTISSLSAESEIRKELEKQVQATKDLIKARGEQAPEIKEKAKDEEERKRREREAADQAERLKAMYANIVGTLEDGIVGSLMAGIEALIGGTKSLGDALKEIASGILKDIGQTLLRFAVNLGMRAAFPGAFAAKGAYFSGGQADFAQNSIKPFAMGGIVTKPTFFKYADGGTFNNGVMGEAGPEAIMPLKRGADGKLGVAAKLDGAMGRYRRSPGSAGGAAGGGLETESGAAVATSQPIDVRYSVERINNVDYVTADQFQRGMQQAAQQGATQGERRALATLRQNTSQRKRIGI